MDDLVQTWTLAGRKPYAIPTGGSTDIAATSFILAWQEFLEQLKSIDSSAIAGIVIASSTGGTHAGMLAGRHLLGGPPVYTIDVAKESPDLAAQTRRLADESLALFGISDRIDPGSVNVDQSFAGASYAVPTAEADDAMLALARSGGWVLDRVYTAKAFAGLLKYDRDDHFGDGDVMFWHVASPPSSRRTVPLF